VYPFLAVSLSIFIASTIFQEFWTGTRARMILTDEGALIAFPKLMWKMRSRYGGFVAHLGVVLMVIGITGSYAYKQENQATLRQGQAIGVGDYTLRYDRAGTYTDRNREVQAAEFSIFRDGQYLDKIRTERRFYTNAEQPTTEVSLRSTLLEDLYVTMPAVGENRQVTLKVSVNPLVIWVWIGGFVMVFGGIMSIIPRFKRREIVSNV
jgi:cytochrome c-type biogenesis protein CcmF